MRHCSQNEHGWADYLGDTDTLAHELDAPDSERSLAPERLAWLEEMALFKLDALYGFLRAEAATSLEGEMGDATHGEVLAAPVASLLAEARQQLEMVREAKDALVRRAEIANPEPNPRRAAG